ncbi:hypothetical protein QR680_011975 [Steinernema hermaphroditum]|uniref:Uncharacterized protein n=1 Tax=Steinernema hermaphroditum TaxID=289476 RepID=A0AA39I2R7_9BILA|nr:hypothetical protein QR680_011975 [Steinernema hermaphroditum]
MIGARIKAQRNKTRSMSWSLRTDATRTAREFDKDARISRSSIAAPENHLLRLAKVKAEALAFRQMAHWAIDVARGLDGSSDLLKNTLEINAITTGSVEEAADKLDLINEGAEEAIRREIGLVLKRTMTSSESERLYIARNRGDLYESDGFYPSFRRSFDMVNEGTRRPNPHRDAHLPAARSGERIVRKQMKACQGQPLSVEERLEVPFPNGPQEELLGGSSAPPRKTRSR